MQCPDNWHGQLVGIIIAAFFAGILLVFLLLVLNLTVAVGTLNLIIFYANIINANRLTYFSHANLTFVPVFISWLNLDIRFDTCFYEGMGTLAKTWLQLAFPTYIIIYSSYCDNNMDQLMLIKILNCDRKGKSCGNSCYPDPTLLHTTPTNSHYIIFLR